MYKKKDSFFRYMIPDWAVKHGVKCRKTVIGKNDLSIKAFSPNVLFQNVAEAWPKHGMVFL